VTTTAFDALLCPPLLNGRDYEAALELIERGLAATSRNSERILEAELYRLKAKVLVARGGPGVEAEAQALLDRALSTARSQHARTLELRAATDIAALWIDCGRREEALNLLAPIYASFTEGFDTQDLKQAKALLDRLR
jgi:predicted ATPase